MFSLYVDANHFLEEFLSFLTLTNDGQWYNIKELLLSMELTREEVDTGLKLRSI